MAEDAAITAKFWKELSSDRTVMLGLQEARDGHTQPMTVAFEGESGPFFFFTTKDNTLTQALGAGHRAILGYASKGHDVFASVHGDLSVDTDPTNVDRFWNKHVEAWYEGGKSDTNLALLRLDTEKATIWLNGSSIGAAITSLFGRDPKEEYKDKMATVAI